MNKLTSLNALKVLTATIAALSFSGLSFAQQIAPSKSRAEVVAELQQSRASGELARLHAEVGVDGYNTVVSPAQMAAAKRAVEPTAPASGKPRAPVAAATSANAR